MTKQERKYLRSVFHHFESDGNDRIITDASTLFNMVSNYKTLLKSVYFILCIEGDVDNEIEPELKELFEKNEIEILK